MNKEEIVIVSIYDGNVEVQISGCDYMSQKDLDKATKLYEKLGYGIDPKEFLSIFPTADRIILSEDGSIVEWSKNEDDVETGDECEKEWTMNCLKEDSKDIEIKALKRDNVQIQFRDGVNMNIINNLSLASAILEFLHMVKTDMKKYEDIYTNIDICAIIKYLTMESELQNKHSNKGGD